MGLWKLYLEKKAGNVVSVATFWASQSIEWMLFLRDKVPKRENQLTWQYGPWPHQSANLCRTLQITAVSDTLKCQQTRGRDTEGNQVLKEALSSGLTLMFRAFLLLISISPHKASFFRRNMLIRFSYAC